MEQNRDGDPLMLESQDAYPAPWVIDVLLGIGVTVTVSLVIAADVQGSEPDAWAYLWAVGLGGLMLVRRRYPVIVLVLSAGAVIAYYAAGYPAIGLAVPLAASAYSAAERGRTWAAVIVCAAMLVLSTAYRLAAGQDPAWVVGYEAPGHALLLGAAIALGDSVRSRRELRRQSVEIATLTAERSAREAEQRAMVERLAIARELHDSVGHALTVVALHAQVAEQALDDAASSGDHAVARDALGVIAATTATTFEDVRRTVANLRKEPDTSRPSLRLSDLERSVRSAQQAGLDVRTHIDVGSPLPAPIEAAVVRVVQESLTNVIRHADASRVEVRVTQADGTIEMRVADDGSPGLGGAGATAVATGAGSGLAGMRERIALLGGTFSAELLPTGFEVRATVPLTVEHDG